MRKESFDKTTILTASDQAAAPVNASTKPEEDESTDLTITEQHSFTAKLVETCIEKPLLAKIMDLSNDLFVLKDLPEDAVLSASDIKCLD